MGDINDACGYIADALATIDGLNTKPGWDDKIVAPEAQVFNRGGDPRMTLGNSARRVLPLGVRVFVQRGDAIEGQYELREYMEKTGVSSVIQALEDDANYPTTVHYVEVTNIGAPFQTELTDAVAYLAVDFDVDVVL